MRILLLLFLAIAAIRCSEMGNRQASRAAALTDSVVQAKRIPGLAATVMVQGKTVWSMGFGHADLEQDIHVDPSSTKFRIGSISKSLTSFGLARLVQEGKIHLDSSVYYYLPSFPPKKYRPTVRQLASHTGGIRHYNGDEFLLNRRFASTEEGLSIFKEDSLLFEPGTQYQYSTYGYNLISVIMEKASGEPFLPWMQKNVIAPLQLAHTVPDHYDSIIGGRTRFYERNSTGWINSPAVDNSYKWAGGGYLSTSEDLVRFGHRVLASDLLAKSVLDEFTRPYTLRNGEQNQYALGWGLRTDSQGRRTFGHTGGSVGGSSHLLIYPEQQTVVAVVTNVSSAGLGDLAFRLAGIFLDK